ncbi:MAG: GtrA family protein [Betaproteobacteria bacterium]|nr:GtrA family protein [Betaproteobacteria bacterium]
MKLQRQFLHFLWIGGIGFVVDGGILTLLSVAWEVNVYAARGCSFFLATLATWWLNRTYAFSTTVARTAGDRTNEYVRHIIVQVGGGLINFGVFSWCLYAEPSWRTMPLLPFAVGSFFGLLWNFSGAKLWTFRVDRHGYPTNHF